MSLMDEAERKRFLGTLRADDDFRATVRRELLTDELLNLPQTVATLVDVIAAQRQDFTALAKDVRTYMERTITLVGDGFAVLGGETSEIRGETSEIRGGTSEIRGEISEIRGDISELRADMEAGFAAVDAGFTVVDTRFDQVNAEIRTIKDQLAS